MNIAGYLEQLRARGLILSKLARSGYQIEGQVRYVTKPLALDHVVQQLGRIISALRFRCVHELR